MSEMREVEAEVIYKCEMCGWEGKKIIVGGEFDQGFCPKCEYSEIYPKE